MNSRCLIVVAARASAAALAPVAAQAKTLKECAAQWDQMKAANRTGGMKYRDFTKQCMSGAAAPVGAAPAPATPTTAAPAPAAGGWSGEAGNGFARASGHDRPRARLRGGVEGRQGGRKDPGRDEMAAILARVRRAQKSARHVIALPVILKWP